MMLPRRSFLRVIGGSFAGPALSGTAWSQTAENYQTANAVVANEPNPDFTYVPGVTPLIAGLRPFRKTTYRLEEEFLADGKLVVHNYGHGGAGITMSWGCAQEVARIIKMHYPDPTGKQVAVLGAGVMGLTTATWLTETLQMHVTVFAKRFVPDTTSNVAGGQWAASKVEFQDPTKFERILRDSHKEHVSRGSAYGVSPRYNYSASMTELEGFKHVPHDLVPRTQLNLPFTPMNKQGWRYSTLLVEPPKFLSKLQQELQKRGVPFVRKEFFAEGQVLALAPDIIVNCTGAGSDAIWRDNQLMPIKGQLVLLPPQPRLQYLFSGNGYVFARADCTVVGGTTEGSYTDDTPDPERCAFLVKYLKDLFDGITLFDGVKTIAPEWLIQDE